MAAKRKEFDQRMFEQLCAIQCTELEICAVLDCDHKTLERWCHRVYHRNFSEIAKEKRALGTMNLRRYQFKQAERNVTMAIWLGKQYLGQTEKLQTSIDGADSGFKIEVVHDIPKGE